MSDIVEHYLSGGRDVAVMLDEYRAANDRLLPVPERPLFDVPEAGLQFELAMRQGPRWRCTRCGFMDPSNPYVAEVVYARPCPECDGGQMTRRRPRRPVDWPPSVAGRERDWVMGVAARLGVLGNDEAGMPKSEGEGGGDGGRE